MKVHAIQTGLVKVKEVQRHGQSGGLFSVLTSKQWTDWLPIYAWLIEHSEGLILVDTGETAQTSQSGYFPSWHPYYRWAVRIQVRREQEIDIQLKNLGFHTKDVQTVVLTHLHTDHAGGLYHFPNSEIYVDKEEFHRASGFSGQLQGYVPQHWPSWFNPRFIEFQAREVGPFQQSMSLTKANDVVIVPTPGHTPNHVSVIAMSDEVDYILAGDTCYTQSLLLKQQPDGISMNRKIAKETLSKIVQYVQSKPTIYLSSHDPDAGQRLKDHQIVDVS